MGAHLWWGKWRSVGLRNRIGDVTWWLSNAYELRIFLNRQKNWFFWFCLVVFLLLVPAPPLPPPPPGERCCGLCLLVIRKGLGLWGISAAAGAKKGEAVFSELAKALVFPISFLGRQESAALVFCWCRALGGVWIRAWSPRWACSGSVRWGAHRNVFHWRS